MRRAVPLIAAALAGLLTGGLAMLALPAPALDPSPAAPEPPAAVEPDGDTSRPVTGDDLPKPVPSEDGLLVVWSGRGLPEGLGEEVAALPQVTAVTTVAGDLVDLHRSEDADGRVVDELDDGWVIGLDALAIAPEAYGTFLPKGDQAAIAKLAPGDALLGESSARLRRLSPGDSLIVADDQQLVVRAVLDDALVGGAELVVHRDDAVRIGIDTERFLLVRHRGERAAVEGAIRRVTGVEVRVRAPGETTFLRHGDAVLTQAQVKLAFGEFAYRRLEGTAIEQDPAWVRDHLDDVEVPVLGTVRCHRNIARQLSAALDELAERQLDHLVDPQRYAGCHAARLIGEGQGLSRHAWGIAIDLDDDTTEDPSVADPRVVETFARWGFTSGGFWLVPDPIHFEYVGGPEVPAPKVDGVIDGH